MFWIADASASGFVRFATGADEARFAPSMLHVLWSQAVFFMSPSATCTGWGLLCHMGEGPGVLARSYHSGGSQLSVSMRECVARTLWLSEESCLIYRVLFGVEEEALWLSIFPSFFSSLSFLSHFQGINLKIIPSINFVCIYAC